MTYVYIDNGTTYDGQGVYGVFKLDTPASPYEKDHDYLSVNMEDMVVGNGPCCDDNTVTDTGWLKRACVLINRYGLEDEL